MKKYRPHIFVLCVLAVVLLAGAHSALHNANTDARFGWLTRDASNEIVLVAIDPPPPSMDKVGIWPWPRRLGWARGQAWLSQSAGIENVSNRL